MCCYACAPSAQAMQWLWLRRGRGALCRLNAAAAGPGMVAWLVYCEGARCVGHAHVCPGELGCALALGDCHVREHAYGAF